MKTRARSLMTIGSFVILSLFAQGTSQASSRAKLELLWSFDTHG